MEKSKASAAAARKLCIIAMHNMPILQILKVRDGETLANSDVEKNAEKNY